MTDSRNQPDLELAKSSPATLGMNSHVIKPGIRANKVEDAGQRFKGLRTIDKPVGCPDLEAMHLSIPNKTPEQPNLKIIGEIEGLISQVNEKLVQLPTDGLPQGKGQKREQALEEIDLFQKTTLYELRKALED